MDKLGIECVVQFQGQDQPRVSAVDFIRKHFDAARRAKRRDAKTAAK
jgi:hypothetical protein